MKKVYKLMMSVTCYLLLAICYLLSDTCYLKLVTSCKNLIPFAPVVWLGLVSISFSYKNVRLYVFDLKLIVTKIYFHYHFFWQYYLEEENNFDQK